MLQGGKVKKSILYGKKNPVRRNIMSKKKKIGLIVCIVLILAVITTAIVVFTRKNKNVSDTEVVYVESVSNITNLDYYGSNRYMGVVETQETKGVDKADDKSVKEVFVNVGDEVKEGDKLFEYDTEEMNLKLKQLELELTSINTNISTLNQQIATLNTEKETVDDDHKIEYTSQIQSLQAQVNQENYNASAKQLEIERQKTAINNAIVYSPMDGVIKEINNDSSQISEDYYGSTETQHFITIMDMGEYRIKASVSEYDISMFYEGCRVIIRSRVDEDMIWYGDVAKVDIENPEQNNNEYYYYGSGTGATKYPVYIALDSSEDILLGQHVYVEFDFGQGEEKEGLWLDDFYIMQEDDGAYVWVEKNDKIEKRKVELGEYDENLWRYEILSGLSEDDYIAFPEDRIKEGMKTTHNIEDVYEYYDDEMYMEDDMYMEDGVYYDEEIYMEDGMYYDEEIYMEDDMYLDEYMDEEYIEDDMMIDEDVIIEEETGAEEAY